MFRSSKTSSATYSWSSWLGSMVHVVVAHQKQVLHLLLSRVGARKSSSKRSVGVLEASGSDCANASRLEARAMPSMTNGARIRMLSRVDLVPAVMRLMLACEVGGASAPPRAFGICSSLAILVPNSPDTGPATENVTPVTQLARS